MKRSAKRYWLTLAYAVGTIFILGSLMAIVINRSDSNYRQNDSAIWGWVMGILFFAGWSMVAGWVAREKGRDVLLWVIVSWIAPIMLVLLLIPYKKELLDKLDSDDENLS